MPVGWESEPRSVRKRDAAALMGTTALFATLFQLTASSAAPPLVVGMVVQGAIPLGAIAALLHTRAFTPPDPAPARWATSPDAVRYEIDGTVRWVAAGVALWMVLAVADLVMAAGAGPLWAIPLATAGLLYTLGAADAVRQIRPSVAVTVGLHRIDVRRTWAPGLSTVTTIGVEQVERAVATEPVDGVGELVLTLRDRRRIGPLRGPIAVIRGIADQIHQTAERPRSAPGPVPTSLGALVEHARTLQ